MPQDQPTARGAEATGRLVVITGPSGVGKSTIVKAVLERTGAVYSVSATTRRPREGEVNGRDYCFLDRPAFERMIERGELLEWAEVFGNLYGTPAEPVRRTLAAGQTVLLEIDVQGGVQIHRAMPRATFVLILPPDEPTLRQRLNGRATEPPSVLERRLAKAKEEILAAEASGAYTYRVVNNQLEQAIEQVVAIVQERQKQ